MRILLVLALAVTACGAPAASPQPPTRLPLVELKYAVFDQVGRPWYCDPDFYPVARANERDLARQRLAEMQADPDYSAILAHNAVVAGAALSDDELLAVYHDWKDLQRLELTPAGPQDVFGFAFVVRPPTDKETERVEGRIDVFGRIAVSKREPAGPPNCPICLSATTLIDTPRGPVPVTELRVGDPVWTLDEHGARRSVPLLAIGSTAAPPGHELIRLVLADGRGLTASPGHPLADGRGLGAIGAGDEVDGSAVIAAERLPYAGRTYDVLPAGATGIYWADGIPVGSTLKR